MSGWARREEGPIHELKRLLAPERFTPLTWAGPVHREAERCQGADANLLAGGRASGRAEEPWDVYAEMAGHLMGRTRLQDQVERKHAGQSGSYARRVSPRGTGKSPTLHNLGSGAVLKS